MKKLIYILSILLIMSGCEEIFVPELNIEDDYLVVEAILVSDQQNNYVYLYKSSAFGEDEKHEEISGANVKLTDDNGNIIPFAENTPGEYQISQFLDENRSYSLSVELGGETYVSGFQAIPEIPSIDSLYGAYEDFVYVEGAAESKEDIVSKYGIQLYSDMLFNGDLNHYRFDGRKVIQWVEYYDTTIMGFPVQMPIYGWRSYYPTGSFNIGGPPEYSVEKNITKHDLEFFINDYYKLIVRDSQYFRGWIYIIDQYGLNENTYNFYNDLNSQLEAEGKIFDPVYIQPEGNIICTSDPKNIVLGNFEISSHKQHRFLLDYSKYKEGIFIKPIPYYYDIPLTGYDKDAPPDFWETRSKKYPDDD